MTKSNVDIILGIHERTKSENDAYPDETKALIRLARATGRLVDTCQCFLQSPLLPPLVPHPAEQFSKHRKEYLELLDETIRVVEETGNELEFNNRRVNTAGSPYEMCGQTAMSWHQLSWVVAFSLHNVMEEADLSSNSLARHVLEAYADFDAERLVNGMKMESSPTPRGIAEPQALDAENHEALLKSLALEVISRSPYWKESIENRDNKRAPAKARNLFLTAIHQTKELDASGSPAGCRDYWNSLDSQTREVISPLASKKLPATEGGADNVRNSIKSLIKSE